MAIQDFSSGNVLTATQMDNLQANDYNQTVSAKVASYVLVVADKGTRITMSNAGATTITVNTSLFAAGDTLFITNIGAGACTITAGTATVSTASSLVLAQYDSGTLYFTSTGVAIWEKYQTGSGGAAGMTLIKRASFSATANTGTTFDGVFSATYDTYLMVVEDVIAATEADDFYFQFRYAGPTTQASANKYAQSILLFGGTQTLVSGGSAAQFSLCRNTGTSTFPSTGQFYISRVGNASEYPVITGTSLETNQQELTTFAGFTEVARTYTGFILSSAASNITGTVAVYGLAVA